MVIIIGIIFILVILIFLFHFINYVAEERNKRLCETLNGAPFIYALDQSSFLCKLNDSRIIDLDTGLEFKFENEQGKTNS